MTRISKFSYDDIISDPEGIAEALYKATHRTPKHFSGIAILEQGILFLFEDGADPIAPNAKFVIAELGKNDDYESVVGIINQRYTADFTTLAIFPIHGELWGLFRKDA